MLLTAVVAGVACSSGISSANTTTGSAAEVAPPAVVATTLSTPSAPVVVTDPNVPFDPNTAVDANALAAPRIPSPNWGLMNVGLPAWQAAHVEDANFDAINIVVNPNTQVVRLTTTLLVPPAPASRGTSFVWPGLQPLGGKNPNNMSYGVLQPVLTWGPSCAPNQLPNDTYQFWWISGQYVSDKCKGGPTMRVEPGDGLLIDMALSGSIWTQTITDLASQDSVSYSLDMQGDWQNWVLFYLEDYGNVPPPADLVFINTTITLADEVDNPLSLDKEGPRNFVSQATVSADGKSFQIPRIILRAKGVPDTYPN